MRGRPLTEWLFNPAEAGQAGGGGVADPNAAAEAAKAAAAEPAAARLAALEAELAKYRRRDAEAEAEQSRAEKERLARTGQAEELAKKYQAEIAERDRRIEEIRGASLRRERDLALAEAIAADGRVLPAAARQLARLWADDFEAVEGRDGRPTVRARDDFRDPTVVVRERLGSADYAHFLAAAHRGGTGQGGAAAQANEGRQAAPTDPEAALFARYRESRAQQADGPVWQRDFLAGLTPRKN